MENQHIVIKYSGGIITDVYVGIRDIWGLNDLNFNFTDSKGNKVNIIGDAKILNLKDKCDLSNYFEYHKENYGGN